MILGLHAADHAAIVAAARAVVPAEACGLLVGSAADRRLEVTRVVAATNLLAAIPGRFEVDPAVRLAVEKQCRGTAERVIGHWHSHPGGPARPSATDLAMAFEPELAWLIVAVIGDSVELGVYRLDPSGGRFRRGRLEIGPENACIPGALPT